VTSILREFLVMTRVSTINIMKIKFIHSVNSKDVLMFERLCQPNSCFFSDSEAFINSYVFDIRRSAFCFNDNRTIFFLNKFNRDTYFFCCPKGINWQDKMFDSIIKIKEKMEKRLKKVWIWELPDLVDNNYLCNKKFNSVTHTISKRYISYLPDYKDTEQFLKRKGTGKIREKWNSFFNSLYKQNNNIQIVCESLTKDNYKDSLKILNQWRAYTKKNELANNKIISREHIFKKDLRMIKDVLKKPKLYESLVLYYDDIPFGVNIAFKLCKTRNLSSSVFCASRIIPGTSEVLRLLFFEKLAKKGYQYCNWGNSYLSSIDSYKQKFKPTVSENSYEYIIDFKD